MRYNTDAFRKDLIQAGIFNDLLNPNRQVSMALLDGCLEAWVDHLAGITDVLTSSLPYSEVRRITEAVCVFDGKVVRIENQRACAWRDYNGEHYFTDYLEIRANDYLTTEDTLDTFWVFLKDSTSELLKERTRMILPAWSPAFVHRMPDEVQAFFFPGV